MRNGSITSFDFCNKINEDENEDAIGISENSNFHLFAMSDGAGGAGIYCKEWANFIVNNNPNSQFYQMKKLTIGFKISVNHFTNSSNPR